MTNNTPDYEDNLAFDPSALNPCNDGKRSSDVLTATLEKCQAIVAKNVELEKKLKIAVKALKYYAGMGHIDNVVACSNIENHCWCEGDIENGHTAEQALKEIIDD